MNPIAQALVDNLILVYFFYGLAFFALGIALRLASRQPSEFKIAHAIRPLSVFGLLHAAHEWIEMFQLIRLESRGVEPAVAEEWARLGVLAASFVMLLVFGCSLVIDRGWLRRAVVVGLPLLWALATGGAAYGLAWTPAQTVAAGDVLARYLLAIPGALLGGWALMVQQRAFRLAGMPQFGQDLVWCASALILYGAIGQLFVRPSPVPPSQVVNSALFLRWFGAPVQLFRGVLAGVLAFFMVRALRAFELENRRRIQAAVQSQLDAQKRTLAVERQSLLETTRLNQELEARARELGLLLDLSNLLAAPHDPSHRLEQALRQITPNLLFADAGMVLLAGKPGKPPQVAAATGYATHDPSVPGARYGPCVDLGQRAVATGRAICRHQDGVLIEFDLAGALVGRECWQHSSPSVAIALPLAGSNGVHGAIVLARAKGQAEPLTLADLKLLAGIARQMGLSIENARLYQEAQAREQMLGDLLYQVVRAQESERQRIARDLHDATGQSLTAIALGLRGVENALAEQGLAVNQQLAAIQGFANDALVELRRIIADLRPPQLDDLGLMAALRWAVQSFQQRNPGVDVVLQSDVDAPRLRPEVETLLYRIVQEALTNIAKHAGATQVVVRLETGDHELVVEVADNGVGFDANEVLGGRAPGWGLIGIRERIQLVGGEALIRSAPGQGTRILVRMPLAYALAREQAAQR
ncbi:MAG TPA: GAF domain-containing sensor histidine kinase [Caldilineaceae bacterium]|nr:GAF domain-containing sensor histidine kinase [Caldilineaceae bacterium]